VSLLHILWAIIIVVNVMNLFVTFDKNFIARIFVMWRTIRAKREQLLAMDSIGENYATIYGVEFVASTYPRAQGIWVYGIRLYTPNEVGHLTVTPDPLMSAQGMDAPPNEFELRPCAGVRNALTMDEKNASKREKRGVL
jgi:hypothetical protein